MFFRLSRNCVPLSCHRCSRRGQLQTSETPQSFVPPYHTCMLQQRQSRRKSANPQQRLFDE
jgi:hypothetical protein